MRYGALACAALASFTAGATSAQQMSGQPQSWLGFSYTQTITVINGERTSTTVVVDVVEDSPADRGGLVAGDTILRINELRPEEDLLASLRYAVQPGDEVRLRVRREGRERVLTLRAAQRPAEYALAQPLAGRLIVIDPDTLRGRIRILLDSSRARIEQGLPEILFDNDSAGVSFRISGDSLGRRIQGMMWNRRFDAEPFRGYMRMDSLWSQWLPYSLDSTWVKAFRPWQEMSGNFQFYTPGGAIALYGYSGVAGAQLAEIGPELGEFFDVEHGVLAMRVPDNSPAYRAGLRTGDVIVRAEGTDVRSVADLRRVMRSGERGRAVRLEIVRRGRTEVLELPRE